MKTESKYSLEVVRQQNERTSMLSIQGHEYIILGPIWPFDYTIRVYNIRGPWTRCDSTPSSAFFHLHPTRYETKKKMRKHISSWAII
jgi:hypothetical protein